jgi:tRNA(Glu) U13 pseudouridine synthase TruD
VLELAFALPAGSYATALLRELVAGDAPGVD